MDQSQFFILIGLLIALYVSYKSNLPSTSKTMQEVYDNDPIGIAAEKARQKLVKLEKAPYKIRSKRHQDVIDTLKEIINEDKVRRWKL